MSSEDSYLPQSSKGKRTVKIMESADDDDIDTKATVFPPPKLLLCTGYKKTYCVIDAFTIDKIMKHVTREPDGYYDLGQVHGWAKVLQLKVTCRGDTLAFTKKDADKPAPVQKPVAKLTVANATTCTTMEPTPVQRLVDTLARSDLMSRTVTVVICGILICAYLLTFFTDNLQSRKMKAMQVESSITVTIKHGDKTTVIAVEPGVNVDITIEANQTAYYKEPIACQALPITPTCDPKYKNPYFRRLDVMGEVSPTPLYSHYEDKFLYGSDEEAERKKDTIKVHAITPAADNDTCKITDKMEEQSAL